MNSATLAYRCALAGYFGLLVLWIAWSIMLSPAKQTPTAIMLMTSTLPLLSLLRGLLYDRRGAFIWLGLLSLIYFIHGVGAAVDASERLPAALEILFSLILFGGSLARLKRNPSG